MKTDFRYISLENDGISARITFRRPPLNVLDTEMIREINRALRDLREDQGLRVVVLAAEGKAFSAGVDVGEHLPPRAAEMLAAFHDVFRHMRVLSCPTIAAVQGPAFGGGCEIACAADIVIASETASLGQPEMRLGVFPPAAAALFPHRIGMARTLQLIFSGELLTARDAERIGLVDRVVPAAELEATVQEAVARLREKSAVALRLAKKAVYAAAGRDLESGLQAVERIFLDELMPSEDAVEGLGAFLEKRAPVWAH